MENDKLEKMTVGDVALGNTLILLDFAEQLLLKLVEKNVLTNSEGKEIILKCIDRQQLNIENIKNDADVDDKERLLRIYEMAIQRWSVRED
jgi:transcriptional regulator CtsR